MKFITVTKPKFYRFQDKLAWCAGIFDGEGYVGLKYGNKNSGKKYLIVAIGQKDRRILDKFKNYVKMGNITGPQKRGGMHYWQVYQTEQVFKLFELLAWSLSPVKIKQFTDAINGWLLHRTKHRRVTI